jgi:hypothetical protein
MENWSIGVVEWWNVGNLPLLHYSTTPIPGEGGDVLARKLTVVFTIRENV